MLHLLVATTNQGKVKEIAEILKNKYIQVSSLADFPEYSMVKVEESGETFQDNALIKARTYGRLTGLITLADDSGLCVDALDGQPGVLSARYASTDAERIAKLLGELKNTKDRTAHFTCSLVIFDPSSEKFHTAEGKVEGSITTEPKGTNGFGYDPIFFCPELSKTFGEARKEEKNRVSHRAQALTQLKELIRKHFT